MEKESWRLIRRHGRNMTRGVLIRFTLQYIWAIKERITTDGSSLHWIYGLYCIRSFLLFCNLGGEFRLRGIGRGANRVIKESSSASSTNLHCFKQLDIIIDWLLGVWGQKGEIGLWLRADETCGEPPIWLAMRLTTSGNALGISLMPRVEWIDGSSPLEFEIVSLVHTADAGRVIGTPAPNESSTEWTPVALAEDRIAGLRAEFVARASPCMRRDAAAK
ncbi:hypothetical protein F0562_010619 [Nyssa sinensis]|uniref:Uncharacterized protein n=1 Tax=Nyssa sinensis TaxID=561372 RepID=A0A5J5A2B2_9ASTE|nr:hypothetical protein F0562_010619 [Nyssa sinensis]